jgi:hypothetical protein
LSINKQNPAQPDIFKSGYGGVFEFNKASSFAFYSRLSNCLSFCFARHNKGEFLKARKNEGTKRKIA